MDNIPQRKSWKKKLYENEEYPDNHTDPTFLEEMRKNVHERHVTYKEAFKGAGLVIQELCLVIIFVITFTYLYNEWTSPDILFSWISALSVFGYCVYIFKESTIKLRHFRAVLMFLILAHFLTPVLKTLTETISTDTIYSTTLFMMAVHLIFFDYGVKVIIVSSSLSINAAVFGSVCLASRLSTPFHAFVLLTSCVVWFVLCPLLLSKLGNPCIIQTVLIGVNLYLLATVSIHVAILFFFSIVFLTIVCPVLFVKWQIYKENIYGPWDEATVKSSN